MFLESLILIGSPKQMWRMNAQKWFFILSISYLNYIYTRSMLATLVCHDLLLILSLDSIWLRYILHLKQVCVFEAIWSYQKD